MIQYPRYRQHRFSSFQVIIAGFAIRSHFPGQIVNDRIHNPINPGII